MVNLITPMQVNRISSKMRWILTTVATLAALAFVTASCALNFMFWRAQAPGDEGLVLGAVSVAADVFKAILPVFIGWALLHGKRAYAALATVFFVLFLAAGLISSVGFVAGNRSGLIGGREGRNAQLELAAGDLKALDDKLSRLTGYPPLASLEAEVSRLEQNARFSSSQRCTDATAPASREFCDAYFKAKANLGAAIEANRLTSKREALASEVNRLRAAGAGVEADPQAGIFSRWVPGLSVGTVRDALALFFAVLVECGAAFGLFLATRHGGIAGRQDQGYPVNLQMPTPANRSLADEPKRITATAREQALTVEPMRFIPDPRWVDGVKG